MKFVLAVASALVLVAATPAAAHVGRGPHRHVVVPARAVTVPVVPRPVARAAVRPVVVVRPSVVRPIRAVAPVRRPALAVRVRF